MTPKLIGGMFVYVMATVLYIVLLSKFNYFQVQSIVVGSSLVLTLLAATLLFNERPSLLNVVGIVLIVVGSLFVVTR